MLPTFDMLMHRLPAFLSPAGPGAVLPRYWNHRQPGDLLDGAVQEPAVLLLDRRDQCWQRSGQQRGPVRSLVSARWLDVL